MLKFNSDALIPILALVLNPILQFYTCSDTQRHQRMMAAESNEHACR